MPVVIFDTPMRHKDGNVWCHMASDDLEYLHRFASKIGLKRQWFQDKAGQPHYDIKSDTVRSKALANGATMVERKVLFLKIREWHGGKSRNQ